MKLRTRRPLNRHPFGREGRADAPTARRRAAALPGGISDMIKAARNRIRDIAGVSMAEDQRSAPAERGTSNTCPGCGIRRRAR